MATGPNILQLYIELDDSEPLVWRRFLVPSDITVDDLHGVVQVVMGWENDHLFRFQKDGIYYDDASDTNRGHRSADEYQLYRFFRQVGEKCTYHYDFGDDWIHTIRLEAKLPIEPGRKYPECLDGGGACPPEDCGGVYGYADLLEIVADPDHEEYEERLDWLGDSFDPLHFSLSEVNAMLYHQEIIPTD